MSVTVNVNGVAISYPRIGDVEWGDEATEFAIQVGSVLQKIGQGNQTPTTDNIAISPGNLTVTTGNTDLGGTLDVTGATNLDSTLDVTGVTTIVDDLIVDTDTLFVDVSTDRVGINTATPTVALDVVGSAAISGTLTAGTFAPTDLTVDTNLIITNSTDNYVGINTTSPTEALDVTGNIKQSGVSYNSDGSVSSPSVSFTSDTNTGLYRIGSDNIGIAVGGSKVSEFNSNGFLGIDNILIVEDEKTSGTAGGTFANGAWRTRDLNTVRVNRITGASLSSNQITLPAGRYRIFARCPVFVVANHKTRLWNITDSSKILDGTTEFSNITQSSITSSIIYGEFIINSQKTITIEHICNTTRITDGFGIASNFSQPEIYTQVFIQRLA